MKKPSIICTLVLLVASNSFCENMPEEISLPRSVAVGMAVYRNLDLRIEAYNTEMAKKDLAKSWGIYNPVLNASGIGGVTAVPGDPFFSTKFETTTLGLTQNLPAGGSVTASTQTGFFSFNPGSSVKDWQSTAGLSVTQPLLRNFGLENTRVNITMSENSLQESVERFRTSTAETVANVITTYDHLYVLRKILETRVASLNSAQKLLDTVSKRTHQAPVKVMEIANAEFAMAQRRKDVVEASRNVRDQEVNLRYLVGIETKVEIIPADPPSREEPQQTEEQLLKAALDIRNDLKQMQISLQSSQLQQRIARHQSWPDLTLNATGGFTGNGSSVGASYGNLWDHPGKYWTAGLQLSVPLGNAALRNEYLKSKIKTEQLEDQIRALKWKIQIDVEADLRALISARLQVQLAEKSKLSSEQRLEAYRKNNEVGTASIQDVINAENDQNTADNAHLEATESFASAVTKLWKDSGLLLDRYNVHIDVSVPEKITERILPSSPVVNLPLTDSSVAKTVEERAPIPPTGGDSPPAPAEEQKNASAGGNPKSTEISTDSQTAPIAVPAPAAKPAGTLSESAPANAGAGETAPAGPEVKSEIPAAAGAYSIRIGEYVAKSQMAEPIRKIKQAGLTATVKKGPKRPVSVIRLYIAEFPDQASATRELNKLHDLTAYGFILQNKERKYLLYAGSHFDKKSALREQARLSQRGITSSLRTVSVSLPSFLLTAGSFPTEDAARAGADKLEKLNLKPAVIEAVP